MAIPLHGIRGSGAHQSSGMAEIHAQGAQHRGFNSIHTHDRSYHHAMYHQYYAPGTIIAGNGIYDAEPPVTEETDIQLGTEDPMEAEDTFNDYSQDDQRKREEFYKQELLI